MVVQNGKEEEIPPTFIQKPQIRQEDDGNKLVFECRLDACPRPDIAWFKGERQIYDDRRTSIRVTETATNRYYVALELDDVFETDAGLYRVTARNLQGEVSASINLNFTPPHTWSRDVLIFFIPSGKFDVSRSCRSDWFQNGYKTVIKHFFFKRWSASQIKAELNEVHGDSASSL
ncbi:unc-22 [Cordylochernes scorpioides]|uniref:Unc-22 n=1 Tax=Cordylochernes scorpioides TaxID=51811 RepID=A0ABY6KDW2_9ARAC|nr:unc-22 [Cordylochernes scorpioides]